MGNRTSLLCLLAISFAAPGCSLTGRSSNSDLSGQSASERHISETAIVPPGAVGKKAGAADEGAMKSIWVMARLSERRGQPAHAKEIYQSMIERNPNDPRPYHRLAVMNARENKWDEAEHFFQQALTLNPSDAELLGDTGYYYYLKDDPQQAELLLCRAMEIDPDNGKYSNNLAILLGEQGRDEESLALFQRNGSEAEAFANLGFVRAQRGEYAQAVQSYNYALTLDDTLRPAAEAMAQLARYIPADERPTAYLPPQRTTTALDTRLARAEVQRRDPSTTDAEPPARPTAGPAASNAASWIARSADTLNRPPASAVAPTGYLSTASANDPSHAASPAVWQYPRTEQTYENGHRYCQPAMPQFTAPATFSSNSLGITGAAAPVPHQQ